MSTLLTELWLTSSPVPPARTSMESPAQILDQPGWLTAMVGRMKRLALVAFAPLGRAARSRGGIDAPGWSHYITIQLYITRRGTDGLVGAALLTTLYDQGVD